MAKLAQRVRGEYAIRCGPDGDGQYQQEAGERPRAYSQRGIAGKRQAALAENSRLTLPVSSTYSRTTGPHENPGRWKLPRIQERRSDGRGRATGVGIHACSSTTLRKRFQ